MAGNYSRLAGKIASSRGGSGINIKPSHKGLLHRDLGVAAGKKIPVSAMQKAANSSDPALRRRAQFALNARKFNH